MSFSSLAPSLAWQGGERMRIAVVGQLLQHFLVQAAPYLKAAAEHELPVSWSFVGLR